MPRRNNKTSRNKKQSNFRFEWVSWSESRLAELRGWIEGTDDTLEKQIQRLADNGWKLSFSENQQSGRYLASLTDKWDREGCAGVSFGIEHGNVTSAILGAVYYATEVIDNGFDTEERQTEDDLW